MQIIGAWIFLFTLFLLNQRISGEGSFAMNMKRTVLTLAATLAVISTSAVAQDDAGRTEYMSACAGCHGETGMGDGPLAELLKVHTPNLTTLAKEKGDGAFPFEYVVWMVDGRKIIRAHGSTMPIWGERYQSTASSERGETADMVAKGRILSLVNYLESIQQ
ncbi:c-type cytochrome [Mameliella sediminis]|uniref:c-type cytochrome n=1 Tax=Mameliella sediminis TaxID=2836866 RepID=UPI001FE393E1|nr:cytochrome c [Mameliella sediminis]